MDQAIDIFRKREMPPGKVEHRALKHPEKGDQAQGIIELFIDVLDSDESRYSNFKQMKERRLDEKF